MKKILLLLAIFSLGISLSACTEPEDDNPVVDCDVTPNHEDCDEPDPVTLSFSGLTADVTVEQDEVFNVLTGVTAAGSDGTDFTENIVVDSADCYIDDMHVISTANPTTCILEYSVTGAGGFIREFVTLTINQKTMTDDDFGPELKVWNWDTAADNDGWNIYVAGGGAVVVSWDEVEHGGSMKLETVSGGLRYETRLDFQGLAMEPGQPYLVRFDAKSSIDGKKFHFNFGELIPSAPWFTPFKIEGEEIFTLTDEWATYEFWFNMELNNQNGGPVLEMGNIEGSEGLDATIWFDNLVVKGGSGEDVFAPVISGVMDSTIYIEDAVTFDALEGVTALDGVDGDLTSAIFVNGDTVDPLVAGVYYLSYAVYDAAGNYDLVERWVTVMADTEAPVLSGVEDTTAFVGEGLTALTDVMAVDGRDGDVTANIVLSGDVFEVDVAGVYNVTYTVSDALGNEATADRVITILDLTFEDTDLITNGNFEAVAWQFFTQEWVGAATKFNIVDGQVVAEVQAFGDNWSQIIEQPGVAMGANKTYRVSFDAMSTVERDVEVELGDSGLANQYVTVGTTMETHTVEFTMGAEDKTVIFKILFGNVNAAALSTMTFDNIMLEETTAVDGEIVADTNVLLNSDFSEMTMLEGWGSWSEAGDEDFRVYYNEGWFTYNAAGDASWKNKLEQGGIALVAGETYRLTFKAKGDLARDFQVSFWDGSAGTESGALALTTDFQEFTFIFEYNGGASQTLEFQLGQLTENFAGTRFFLDDVKIEVAIPGEGEDVYEMTDLMPNGTFDVNPWYMWAADWNSTSVTADFSGGNAVFDIVDFGAENWNIQFVQEGLALVENKTYRLTFEAMTTVDRDVNVKVIAADGTEYTETVSLTTTTATYTVDFTFAQADSAAKISIEMGGPNDGGIVVAVPSVITYDNVMLEETTAIDGDLVVDTDQVVNGDFGFTNLNGWSSWTADWLDPMITGSLSEAWNELVFTYDGAGTESWNHQINFDGITWEVGKTYKLSFDAKGDAARDFQVNVYDGSNGYETGILALGTEFQSYEHVFTYMNNPVAKVEFQLGKISDNFAGTMFYLDNVKIEVLVEDEPVVIVPVWNGYGGTTAVEGEDDVVITYDVTTEWWWDFSAQHEFLEFDGTNNAIDFTFTGEVGHKYVFKVESGSLNKEVKIDGDGTEQTVQIALTDWTEEQRDALSKVIVFTEGAAGTAGTVTVSYEGLVIAIPDPVWVGMSTTTVVEGTGDVAITYDIATEWWWDFNAQQQNVVFDGTNDAIEFTFTGVVGHNYKFKVEAPGGLNKETADITGDGLEQTIVLDLSDWTLEQRNSLSLVVVFCTTQTATGTVNVAYEGIVLP